MEEIQAGELGLELSLAPFEIIEIGVRSEPFKNLSVRIPQRHGAGFEPAIRAIGAAEAKLDIEILPRLDGSGPFPQHAVAVVGVEIVGPACAELFFGRAACVFDPLAAEIITPAVRP